MNTTKRAAYSILGVILLAPAFELESKYELEIEPSLYRLPFPMRAASENLFHDCSLRNLFSHWLKHVGSQNPLIIQNLHSDCFSVLGPIYGLISYNWLLVNTCLNRELATAELSLENSNIGLKDVEHQLMDLHMCRRRCISYQEFVNQAKAQFQRYGQQAWRMNVHNLTQAESNDVVQELIEDFEFLEARFSDTFLRIEKSINLVSSVVAIGEAQRGLDENRGMARLTLLATVFLPFSTIATILSIQGDFGPSGSKFWLFWVIVILLTALVIGIFMLYTLMQSLQPMSWSIGKLSFVDKKVPSDMPGKVGIV